MGRKIYCLLLFFVCTLSGYAQSTEDIINGKIYAAKVKLVDEFINRFNLAEWRTDLDSVKNNPRNQMVLLFDLDMFPSQEDSAYMVAEEFIETVIKNNIKIDYNDGHWYAQLRVNISLANKKKQCVLYLTYVSRGDDMYKWQIAGVEGDIFMQQPVVPDLFISPTAHEMEFVELKRVTRETYKYIDSYLPLDYEYNSLSAFSFAVSNGLLKIESIETLDFVFEQVSGYRFYVSYFPRETQNSGWLIHKLERR